MATCLDIITFALRQARILGPGREPKPAEAAEGMVALQSLYDQWRTGGMFGTLEDVYLEESGTAEEGKRYYVPTGLTLTDATSTYVDECGVTRQPYDLAMYEAVTQAGAHTAKLYDRTAWVDLIGLVLSSNAPMSGRNAYGLAACLGTSAGFIAMFGAEPNAPTLELARQFLRNVMSKQGSTQADKTADYF